MWRDNTQLDSIRHTHTASCARHIPAYIHVEGSSLPKQDRAMDATAATRIWGAGTPVNESVNSDESDDGMADGVAQTGRPQHCI
jgi:hypothetical protein